MRRAILAWVLCCGAAWGQTEVDLGRQGKNFDFSTAGETRPAKTGNTLPVFCNPGDLFFLLDAAPGANLYGCSSLNTWSVLSGGSGGGVSGTSAFQTFITDAKVSNTATAVMIPGGIFRNNNSVTNVTTSATVQANAGSLAPGAQIWIEFDPATQAIVLSTNVDVTQGNLTVTNIALGSATANGFTSGRIPIATCIGGATADNWTGCTDMRTAFVSQRLTAGPGISIGPADNFGTQQIAASAIPNPQVYRTLVNGTSGCPATEATLASYQFPAIASVGAGDSIEITAWFQKTGTSTPAISVRVDGTYGNSPSTLGNLTMSSPLYMVHVQGLVLSSSSIAYSVLDASDTGTAALKGTAVVTGAAITATPLVEFRASGCMGTDTVQVLGAVITLSKGANF